ncbi:conserved hypothetical protein [Trichinella spiralis]|uniref:hypothetical protein n=1 Tax=Trichinella spiralis TaxID=6334 RepID=UPI0001EFDBFD|nr:conserved hypothetical protein [Trichinella spiralis]
MKIKTIKRRQQSEQQRLRETILQVLDQLETDSSEEWRKLTRTTRISVDTFLKEPSVKPALTEELVPQSQLGKLQHVQLLKFDGDILQFKLFWDQFEVSVDRQEDLVAITKILHLWSCLSGAVLKAIEGITVCAENYPEVVRTFHNRFHRVPEVVESHG